MRLVFPLIAVTLASANALGNPIVVSHPAYIRSEKLVVELGDDAAFVDGRFHFTSTAKKGELGSSSDVRIDLPLWIPSDAKRADPATAAFLTTFSASQLEQITDQNRGIWESATKLTVTVGSHSLRPTSFVMFDPRSKQDNQRISVQWQRQDFFCLSVTLEFPPEWLRGDPEVHVSYRQGLLRSRRGTEFHYVPTFWQLPEGMTTVNLDQYSMKLVNRAKVSASLGSVVIYPGFSAILPLAHHQAIAVRTGGR